VTPSERLDAFFERLKADPALMPIMVVLGPYRAMASDPTSLVQTLDALAAHWAASANVPLESEK
jgi:hypothetical protein